MARKESHYDPHKVRGNFGPGGLGDQYDNERFRSLDRDQNPGGVTGVPLDDDFDLHDMRFAPERSETRTANEPVHEEPARDADLSLGAAGTSWNQGLRGRRDFSGVGPRGWELSDERLKERVSDVLLHSLEVDASDLDVFVEERVVYLKGTIRSKSMRRVAEDLILSVPGVEDVFTTDLSLGEESYRPSPRALDEARRTDKS
jgi:hypothetical protein